MNFDLTNEQISIRDMTREFANRVLRPRVEEIERAGEYPSDILTQMGSLGMMGIPFPPQYGGGGGDWVGMHLCIEEISRVDPSLAGFLDVTTSVVANEIYSFGTEEQKNKWLTPLAQGKEVGVFGLTEPDSGSDAGSMKTTAILEGKEWIINGSKQFITHLALDRASIILLAAKTKVTKDGPATTSTLIVPKDAPGLTIGSRYETMAFHSSVSCPVFFGDCRIPKDNVLGDIRKGFGQHLSVLQTGRISMAAVATGLAQACLDEVMNYSRTKYHSHKSILESETIPFKLADMAMMIELSRTMYLKAAWLKDHDRKHTLEAHFAKLFATETAKNIVNDMLNICGLDGCSDKLIISENFKAAKLLEILEGTSEMHRLVIARELLNIN